MVFKINIVHPEAISALLALLWRTVNQLWQISSYASATEDYKAQTICNKNVHLDHPALLSAFSQL